MKQDVPVHGGLLKRSSNTLLTLQDSANLSFPAPVKCGANHSAVPSEMARPIPRLAASETVGELGKETPQPRPQRSDLSSVHAVSPPHTSTWSASSAPAG